MRSVRVWRSSTMPARLGAMTSKETKTPACDGKEVTIAGADRETDET